MRGVLGEPTRYHYEHPAGAEPSNTHIKQIRPMFANTTSFTKLIKFRRDKVRRLPKIAQTSVLMVGINTSDRAVQVLTENWPAPLKPLKEDDTQKQSKRAEPKQRFCTATEISLDEKLRVIFPKLQFYHKFPANFANVQNFNFTVN